MELFKKTGKGEKGIMSVVCLICGSELEDNSNDDYISVRCPKCKEQRVSGRYMNAEEISKLMGKEANRK
jgi:phage FluMu protein Com